MLRKVKKSQSYLHLISIKQPQVPQGSMASNGWQSFDPGETGDAFFEKVRALAGSGVWDCFVYTDAKLKQTIYQQLPSWIRALKMDYPQLDFHIHSGRSS